MGRPTEALAHYEALAAAHRAEGHDGRAHPRAAALRLTRTAGVHVDVGDLDGALGSACEAVEHLGGVSSARGTSSLADLRAKLVAHRETPLVRDFLEQTA
ncbi:hypothetical protein ACWEV4_20090 [Streptomyces sp. NPDC003860]